MDPRCLRIILSKVRLKLHKENGDTSEKECRHFIPKKNEDGIESEPKIVSQLAAAVSKGLATQL